MSEKTTPGGFKPKKIRGAVRGTRRQHCAVHGGPQWQRPANYRGYDILDIAEACEFEEIAYLLVHGSCPTPPSCRPTRPSSKRCATACRPCAMCSSSCPLAAQPDGCHAHRLLGAGRRAARARGPQPAGCAHIADRLMASFGSMLLYGTTTATTAAASTCRPTTTPSVAISCICCSASLHQHRGSAPCTPR